MPTIHPRRAVAASSVTVPGAVDGAGRVHEGFRRGQAAAGLICSIFSRNEFFVAVDLTAIQAGTAPIFLVGFVSSEGLFAARPCAATPVSPPVVLAGWLAQNKLVRGLSTGAVT